MWLKGIVILYIMFQSPLLFPPMNWIFVSAMHITYFVCEYETHTYAYKERRRAKEKRREGTSRLRSENESERAPVCSLCAQCNAYPFGWCATMVQNIKCMLKCSMPDECSLMNVYCSMYVFFFCCSVISIRFYGLKINQKLRHAFFFCCISVFFFRFVR